MKKNFFTYIFFGIFALTGIGLLIGGFFWMKSGIDFKNGAVEVVAEISDIESYRDSDGDSHHNVFINYEFNGETYTDMPLNEYNSSMYIGKEITILCRADQPGRTMTGAGIYLGGGIMLGIGFTFALVGIIPIISSLIKGFRSKDLLSNGQILYATVDEIVYNTSYSVNGQHPYVIYCSYKDDYKDITYRFKSNNLWSDPSLVFPIGSTITVHVDPKDYSKHYVNAEKPMSDKIVDYT
uniref:hypothetical protein n=1 Tax=Acetatifactor sp. TaxID=1872090 RepID=UPI004057985E